MNVVRRALLAASDNDWLRRHASERSFVKRGVRRFMPGERLEDALTAATGLARQGIGGVLTELGESVRDPAGAAEAVRHYADALASIEARGLDCDISVKLTHLGCDVDLGLCVEHVRSLVTRAHQAGRFVWIDMEQSFYVDRTLDTYRQLVTEFQNVGVCLQAYLHRTADDLASLIALGGGVRLVKGAYRESPDVAYARKQDVDSNFLALAAKMLSPEAAAAGLRPVFGTHDAVIIRRIGTLISSPSAACEIHMLYGIQPDRQLRLVREGYRVRALVSYGTLWFPWYMRRLAERPANVLFAAKAMFSR